MSTKKTDKHNRWRSKTVAFRLSPEEATLLDTYVALSGLTKQDYIASRVLRKEIVVHGNPRVHNALRGNLLSVYKELKRIEKEDSIRPELVETINMLAIIIKDMKENAYVRE